MTHPPFPLPSPLFFSWLKTFCGRCGDGEDVCDECDALLAELELELNRELRRSRSTTRLASVLRRRGFSVIGLDLEDRVITIEGLGDLRRVPASEPGACWELLGDAGELDMELTVAALVDCIWEARRHATAP